MNHEKENGKPISSIAQDRECDTCLFVSRDLPEHGANCLRFARFVDHALNETSRNCDYWTPSIGNCHR